MPRGTCEVCGCTATNACPPTCHWRDEGRQYCSQCVGWILPNSGDKFAGVLPYGLWPVRTLEPVPVVRDGKPVRVWVVDVRRIACDVLERLAYAVAPAAGCTVEEWLENEGADRRPFAIQHTPGQTVLEAPSVESAVGLLDEFRATGRLAEGHVVQRRYLTIAVPLLATTGGVHRG